MQNKQKKRKNMHQQANNTLAIPIRSSKIRQKNAGTCKMLLAERHQLILDQLTLHGRITSVELAKTLAVSEDTIRRDLNKLGELKLLRRVHGGALVLQEDTPDYFDRLSTPDPSKKRFLKPALDMLEAGQTIVIDSGETCRYLAQNLPANLPLTVVTGCPLIVQDLMQHPQVHVIQIGGRMFKPAMRTVGNSAIEMIKQIRFDLVFMGICAFHVKHGFCVSYLEEAEVLRATIEQADRTVLMGPHDKLDKTMTFQIVPAQKIHHVITDAGVRPDVQTSIQALGIELTIVPSS
ncbi:MULTISPECIES: DeoR/GlpR family DNA-binding transcription regulator [Pseudoalteromonas]|uniref:DeoR/GlpR family DNA-binding transcription regulator n=1 Tax=Pseudoalteromonas obscura TaxID=3048491 RepID=A0ABT7EKW5_9GAMM|nr:MULTISPECIES: DeoR/GlpR family DNA-binding transcription regulator [Pseudoalteromonas]MDK2595692.1 DeoR/GlpR family DNA-binding transcription regulator [Pseudoalteromonas sp. P94(2023)]